VTGDSCRLKTGSTWLSGLTGKGAKSPHAAMERTDISLLFSGEIDASVPEKFIADCSALFDLFVRNVVQDIWGTLLLAI
jgi:hypothetical protein